MDQEFDQDNINSIKTLLKNKFSDIALSYIENAKQYMSEIKKGIDTQNTKKVEDNAHPLKSSSGMMGLVLLKDLAEKIEDQAIEGTIDFNKDGDIHSLYLKLEHAAERGFDKLLQECSELAV